MTIPPYEQRSHEKRIQQLESIPKEWRLPRVPSEEEVRNALEYIRQQQNHLLSPQELEITETTNITILLHKLATSELSSVAVTTAFAKRAALAQQLTGCCTEIFFADALAQARELDEYLAREGRTVGPLHGLPVSVKDLFEVRGVDTSIGWVGLTDKPAKEDGHAVQTLRRMGAVLYVKTNVPQSMMMSDSYNHVFGQCVHPLNRALISGGSSGGEASLVCARGSILGIGTDIGGSIRIPASLCGLYGLSPSSGRQPYEQRGLKQDIVRSVAGPMATSLASVETYMSALASVSPWEIDPRVIPMPWRAEQCTISKDKRLKIGFVIDDGVVRVQPPIARAVREVVEALRRAGHEVIEWDATSHNYAYKLWEKAILSDGGENCRKLCSLSGEPLIEGMLVGTEKDLLTTSELHQLILDKYTYETTYLHRWHAAQLDALIMPVTPWVGYKPWTWVRSHQYVGYTSIWNLLDYASLAMPVTVADEKKDRLDIDTNIEYWGKHVPRNASDEFNYRQYDINLVKGMPVGIQVVGGKFGEEKCIAVAKVIEEALVQFRK
ncbi:hypothetical protein VTN96DRAFT_2125 [Rasamsonia emersonii]